MIAFLLACMILVGALMAVVARRTDNDPVVWGMFGFLLPFFAVLFLPGMLDGRVTGAIGSDH